MKTPGFYEPGFFCYGDGVIYLRAGISTQESVFRINLGVLKGKTSLGIQNVLLALGS